MKTKYKFEDLLSTVQKMTLCSSNFDRNEIVIRPKEKNCMKVTGT